MSRPSSIKRLPPAILKEVNVLLSEGRVTLDEIVVHLRGLGVEEVSRSALGRHKQQFDKVAAKLRQSRETTEALVRELGPKSQDGEQGRLLTEMLRSLVYDYLEGCVAEGKDLDPRAFQTLSRTARELAQALRLDQDFQLKIREQAEKEARKEAEDRLNGAARLVESEIAQAGLTPAQVLERMQAVYRGEA